MPHNLTLTEASGEIRAGRLSPVELLRACLARIDALDDRVRAWVTLDREGAEADAQRLQEELARNARRGPLHGIPVGIKDIIYTRGIRTSAGSKFLADFVPDFDATVVSRLREAAAYHAERFTQRREDFGPGIRSLIEEGMGLSAVAYADARRHQLAFRLEVRASFADCDLLLTPATPTPAPQGLASTGDPAFNAPWSYAGLPTAVLPVGLSSDGLPTAVQLVGRPLAEPDLLTAALWCESRLGWDGAPELRPGS